MHIKESNQKHRSNKRKGFTLIEVLVAIACSTIAITTITGSLVFVNKINTQLIEKSSTLYKVKELKHYILDNFKEGDDCKKDGNDIVYYPSDGEKKTIYSNITNISNVTITPKDTDYYKYILDEDGNNTDQIYYTYTTCTINYNQNGDKEYKFIVAANPEKDDYKGSSSEIENIEDKNE